jgi:hypothetical protein
MAPPPHHGDIPTAPLGHPSRVIPAALHEALAWLVANGRADVGGQEF